MKNPKKLDFSKTLMWRCCVIIFRAFGVLYDENYNISTYIICIHNIYLYI